MSRSYKKIHCHYIAHGSCPKQGKTITSRKIRRAVRKELFCEQDGFDFVHFQDKNRGSKGSRSDDYGWHFFGDGFVLYFEGTSSYNKHMEEGADWFKRSKRK
jgi:hypothetical protein